MNYRNRVIDPLVTRQLKASGAVLIRGVKGSGKTETARHHAKSEIAIDDSPMIEAAMQSDPRILLQGEVPRLIDEWQEQPLLWNTIRHEVDRRKSKGQFILTGSANPEETAKLHSGVGRFGVIRLQTMSWYERGWSSGEVSLQSLLSGENVTSEVYDIDLSQITSRLIIGGWPAHLDLDEEEAVLSMGNYFELLTEVDLSRVSDIRRDPVRIKRVLQSLARNISTECALSKIAADAGGADGPLANDTVRDYHDALTRLMVEDDLNGWNPRIRSRARLRSSAKHHFADPSLAAAALGLDSQGLMKDLEYLGLLFESWAIHDLRIYADSIGADIYYYRDSNGVEADAILEKKDGSWAAFEIKLGIGGAEQGAKSLLKLKDTIDTDRSGEPLALVVLSGSGFAHKRNDGVYVVPIQTLKP
ncbi:MAG: ATP-binding protein [Coriobacteriia bacterium]